jgi:ABC-2 type transport system ATP-binding protein
MRRRASDPAAELMAAARGDQGKVTMVSDLAVEVTGLRKSYGSLAVLSGVDLTVERGSVYSLLGPNGAGKTTIVRILATLARADAGTARVAGCDVITQRHIVRRKISLTGQYTAVDGGQTGDENLRMMGRLAGLTSAQARQRSSLLLAQFDLADASRRKAATYSGGMRRRLDLAASLMGQPEVIFLDEPTTGLDLRSRQAMWQVITDLADSGVTIFLTTQYLEEADQLASRVSVLDGQIVAEGSPHELKQQVGGQRLDLVLTCDAALDEAGRLLGRRVVRWDRAELTVGVATDGTAAHVRGVLDEVDPGRSQVQRFAVHAASLDDVFLALTGHSASTDTQAAPDAQQENCDV